MSLFVVILRISIIIFIAEALIMAGLVVLDFSRFSDEITAIIDAISLVLLSTPVIYLWVIKPYIDDRDRSATQLQAAHDGLDKRVKERTLELEKEIAARALAAAKLHEETKLVDLLHSVTLIFEDAPTVEVAMQACIDRICEYAGWAVGHIYVTSSERLDVLIPTNIWHLEDPDEFAILRKVTEETEFKRGAGLPGRVMASGEPIWITDVMSDPQFPRAQMNQNIGVKSGFAFPVLIGAEVVAVWEFFSKEAIEPNETIQMAMRDVGSRLGRLIERTATLQKLADSEIRQVSFLENTLDGIIIINKEGVVVRFNPAAEQMFGFRSIDALGKNIADLVIPPKFSEAHRRGLKKYLNTGKSNILGKHIQLSAIRANGEEFPVELTVTHTQLKGQPFFTAFIRDNTESTRAMKTLREAKEAAEIANLAKTEFLANMSHELRTPLNSIIGFSEIMFGEIFGPLGKPEYRDYAKDIHDSGQHLLALINDILDVACLEMYGLNLAEQNMDVSATVHSCYRLVKDRAQKFGLTIEVKVEDSLPLLFADERRVKQIIINLLANSIKFTPKGGMITLSAGMDQKGRLEFIVSDTGIGIAPNDIQRVLSIFGQADSSLARKYEGSGLGLPISKKLTELHGGELILESKPGVGTKVSVIFPKERLSAHPAKDAKPSGEH